jgi:stress response protein YsnF
VGKETVPVERVRLGKEQVTEEKQVSEQVRKEQIETDDQSGKQPRR